jgi:hypothetical protein
MVVGEIVGVVSVRVFVVVRIKAIMTDMNAIDFGFTEVI